MMWSKSTPLLLLFVLGAFGCAAETTTDETTTGGEGEAEDALISDPPGKAAAGSLLPADYESGTAKEKQDALWTMISADEYCGRPGTADRPLDYVATNGCIGKLPNGGIGYMIKAVKSLFSLGTTFDRSSDELPRGRHKIFHPFGSVAKAELTVSAGSPYSGMFASTGKAVPVIIRLAPGGGGSFIPGIATKFLIDGKPSVNTQAIQDFDGQGEDWNYFHAVPSNVVPQSNNLLLKTATEIFKLIKSEPNHLQLTNLASIGPDGKAPATVREPYQIQYRPHGDLATTYANAEHVDFRAVLRRIPPGTVLYDVYARASERDTAYAKIAEIKTTSWLVASGRGDAQLFFRHFRGTN
jgi:hypothetical protein